MKLTQAEITALKALAQLAPAIVKTLSESVASQAKPKRGRPKKALSLSEPAIDKGEQNIPTEKELAPPNVSKQEKEDGRHIRANTSKKIRKTKGTAARREPMKILTGRPNLFDKMPQRNDFKEDTIIDKKLWEGKRIADRGDRQTLVEAECSGCHSSFDVSPNEIKKDYDGNLEYICNTCLLEKRQ